MKKMPQISEAELEVMKIVWELGETTSAEIIERLSDTTEWKPKTIHTLVSRLVAKGALLAETTGGKAYIYTPQVSESEYKSYANSSFLEKLYNGSVKLMLASFIKEEKITKEEMDALRKMLDEDVK